MMNLMFEGQLEEGHSRNLYGAEHVEGRRELLARLAGNNIPAPNCAVTAV